MKNKKECDNKVNYLLYPHFKIIGLTGKIKEGFITYRYPFIKVFIKGF